MWQLASLGLSKERSPVPWTGAPCSPQRTWAEKDGAQPLQRYCHAGKKTAPRARIVAHEVKAFEKSRFRPMYAEANMGHPSKTNDLDLQMDISQVIEAQLFSVCDVE
jgi:hypothetical protein